MRWIKFCMSLMLFGMCSVAGAQELTVKSVTLMPADKSAVERPVIDGNGDTCALVKIKTPKLEGLLFPNKQQYMGDVIRLDDGTYLVYKSPFHSKIISYQHADYVPGQIDMGDYGYRKLKSGKTYLAVLEAPAVSGINKCIAVLKVFPANAEVTFDGRQVPVEASGVYEFAVAEGTYSYSVSAPDHRPASGSMTLAQGENKSNTVRLSPITHEVVVSCNIGGAHVFVDNIDYGKVGKVRMPQGSHVVRVQYEGYLDSERTVDIDASVPQLSFTLKKNENVVNIHATPVTIYSTSKRIYKNNKELKGWKSGVPVKFMPGKYMISDDNGDSKLIIVDSKPQEVRL